MVSQLGQHFQDGRLDQAEFGERVSAAISAKTASELDVLMTDLPQAGLPQAGVTVSLPGRRQLQRRASALFPAASLRCRCSSPRAVIGGWHHGGRAAGRSRRSASCG